MKANGVTTIRICALLVIATLLLPACDSGAAPVSTPGSTPAAPAGSTTVAAAPSSAAAPTTIVTVAASPTAAPTRAATAPGASSGDPGTVVRGAFDKLKSAGPYRTRETDTSAYGGQTQATETVREFVPPDRTHAFFKPALVNFSELITIGSVWYYKDLNGTWSKGDKSPAPNTQRASISDLLAKAVSDVQVVGPDVVNGTPAAAYTWKFNLQSTPAMAGTIKAWIAAGSGLPIQVDAQSTLGEGTAQAQVQIHTTYEYDDAIRIDPPIP